jgi:hypothetical protein
VEVEQVGFVVMQILSALNQGHNQYVVTLMEKYFPQEVMPLIVVHRIHIHLLEILSVELAPLHQILLPLFLHRLHQTVVKVQ